MGKRNRRKKREETNHNQQTYLKIFAKFLCSNEKCQKQGNRTTWNSAHGWGTKEHILCDVCGMKVKTTNVVDEKLEINIYRCSAGRCENSWESIRGKHNHKEDCYKCGAIVIAEDYQERLSGIFGRHYYFTCSSDKCQVEWEDFSLEPEKTQRCVKCKHRGDIVSVQKVRVPNGSSSNGDQEDDGDGPGKGRHIAQYCDMCQALRKSGQWGSCIPWRKVKSKFTQLGDTSVEEIVSVK